ncbi:MAG: acetyl-CoA synthase subunit gamma [Deltaproteobacteria bacterium]|nr:acetyl-CoA synthase subunit gamma [Deltaproteobacteria bacterium]
MAQPFVLGATATPAGPVPRVNGELTPADRQGTLRVRVGFGRQDYKVVPGLYALNHPTPESPVLVSANYKLSFDHLRQAAHDLDAWVLVLDTKGINVWCAAGKGTMGTAELAGRVRSSGLEKVVSHRKLLLPQLAAPGVAAHLVKKQCGFGVTYGPVLARDLPAFLAAGMKAEPGMRRVSFPIRARTVLVPVELTEALKTYLWLLPLLLVLAGLGGLVSGAGFWANMAGAGMRAVGAMLLALVAGAVASPILLPWLPGRAFSLKGLWPGLAGAALLWALWPMAADAELLAWCLVVPALSSFLAMNFTGASTYTSLSGVKREMRLAVPLQIAATALGLGLWIYALVTG